MNFHWPYNIYVILLRSMQTFAGLNELESARPMPVSCSLWNYRSYHKLSVSVRKNWILLSVWKNDLTTISHWCLYLPTTIGRLCRHNVSAAYTVYQCQLLRSVSMNPVNNWIQSNATSKFRVEPTSWPRRHTVSVARAVSWYRLTTVTVRMNWNKTSILKSLLGIRKYGYLLRRDAASSRSSLLRLPAPWWHQPRPLSMRTWIGQSTPLQPLPRTKLYLWNYWIIVLTVWHSDWRYKVTFW